MSQRVKPFKGPSPVAGLSLIELMVALILGLIVVGGAVNIFVSNRATYRATENLARLQENARVAFELMSRDLREVGGNPCDASLPVVNVLKDPASQWWTDFSNKVFGYDGSTAMTGTPTGSAEGARVAGTDAIELRSGTTGAVTVTSHNPTSAQFKVNTVNHGLNDGDLIAVCDFDHVAITQVTNAQPGINDTVVHNAGSPVAPGNCSKGLGIPADPPQYYVPSPCTTNGIAYTYGPNSRIARLQAVRWYVGNSSGATGGRSLYQVVLRNNGGVLQPTPVEVADGVQDMQLRYLLQGAADFVDASTIADPADWARAIAVEVRLTLVSPERVGTDGQPLTREFAHVVTLRNAVQ